MLKVFVTEKCILLCNHTTKTITVFQVHFYLLPPLFVLLVFLFGDEVVALAPDALAPEDLFFVVLFFAVFFFFGACLDLVAEAT